MSGIPIRRRAFVRGAGMLAMTAFGQTGSGSVVYDGRFVPEGAACKFAFVNDHHYWPDHKENWGGGAQITSNTNRRMPDLAAVLNEERPDLSVHAGDVISAGGSFYPTPSEYAKQLAFAADLYKRLAHPHIPMIGNHETLEGVYERAAQLAPWSRLFGAPYRSQDLKGWRIIALHSLIPNPGGTRDVYGIDAAQTAWLRQRLQEATERQMRVVICTHVPPSGWQDSSAFEEILAGAPCVRVVLCGHTHRNVIRMLGGVPIVERAANVTSPFGYTMVHCYPDGRVILVQKAQHFPADDFVSLKAQGPGPLGSEGERFLTVGGTSRLPLTGLKVLGKGAKASIHDGHLRLTAGSERAQILVDAPPLRNGRMTLTMTGSNAGRMGGIALAGPGGEGGVEAALTARYSPDGKVYLARPSAAGREVLARDWFNISDHIAYRLTFEVRDGKLRAAWKNMLELTASVDATAGQFGLFVDGGTVLVTDLRVEALA
jgi:hypothetical protein